MEQNELREFRDLVKSGFGFLFIDDIPKYWKAYFSEMLEQDDLKEVVEYLKNEKCIHE